MLEVQHGDSIGPDGGGIFSPLDCLKHVFSAEGWGWLIEPILMHLPNYLPSVRILSVSANGGVLFAKRLTD